MDIEMSMFKIDVELCILKPQCQHFGHHNVCLYFSKKLLHQDQSLSLIRTIGLSAKSLYKASMFC